MDTVTAFACRHAHGRGRLVVCHRLLTVGQEVDLTVVETQAQLAHARWHEVVAVVDDLGHVCAHGHATLGERHDAEVARLARVELGRLGEGVERLGPVAGRLDVQPDEVGALGRRRYAERMPLVLRYGRYVEEHVVARLEAELGRLADHQMRYLFVCLFVCLFVAGEESQIQALHSFIIKSK